MNTLILALVLAAGPTLGIGPSLSESSGSNPVLASADFGQSFGSLSYGPGIPAPSTDCIAASAGGDLICNGIRSYPIAAAPANQGGSTSLTLSNTCAAYYPGGPPPTVKIESAGNGGSISRCTAGCTGSALTLTSPVNADWNGAYTITPQTDGPVACDGAGAAPAIRVGAPTTVGSPWYWSETGGYAGPQQMGAKLGGSDYFTTSSPLTASDWASVIVFTKDTIGAGGLLFASGAYNSDGFGSRVGANGSIYFFLQTNNGVQTLNSASVAAGAWNVLILASSGGSLWMNFNGVETTTSITGTQIPSTHGLVIGGGSDGFGAPIVGAISRFSYIPGTTTAAQRSQMVKSQMSLLASKGGSELTHTRVDSTLCCPVSDAACYWLAPNVPCVQSATSSQGGAGVRVDAPISSRIINNCNPGGGGWTRRGTTTVTTGQTDPSGGTGAALVTVNDWGGDDIYQLASGYSANAPLTTAMFVRRISTSGVLKILNASDGSRGSWNVNMALLPDAEVWLTRTHPAVSEVSAFQANASGDAGVQFSSAVGGSARTFIVYTIMQSENPVRPRVVGGVAYAAASGTILTMPTDARMNPAQWAIGVGATISKWTGTADQNMWSTGDYSTPNSMCLEMYTDGKAYFTDYDAAGTSRQKTFTHAFSDGSRHLVVCNSQGQQCVVDGALASMSATAGAGTGIAALLPTIYIGQSVAGKYRMPGVYERIVQCRKGGPQCR